MPRRQTMQPHWHRSSPRAWVAQLWTVDQRCFQSARKHMRVCQRGWAGRPWARYPKTPHFYWLGLGRPGPPQPLTFIDGPGPARPPKALTFIDGPWARPAHPNPSLLSTRPSPPNPSLLLARPLASISQARPRNSSRRNSAAKKRATGTAAPYFPRFGALPIWQTLKS